MPSANANASRKAGVDAAIEYLNKKSEEEKESILGAVQMQLGGNDHPLGFNRDNPEYVILSNSDAATIAAEATKLGLRCWDKNNRQIVKEILAARVYAVHTGSMKDPEWFEPSLFGSNAGEYLMPMMMSILRGIFVILTMLAANYLYAYLANKWACHRVSFWSRTLATFNRSLLKLPHTIACS